MENQTASPRDGENQTVLEHGEPGMRLQRVHEESSLSGEVSGLNSTGNGS